MDKNNKIFIGDTVSKHSEKVVKGEFVTLLGETFYKIHNYDEIEPFFMSIVSSSDHWLFIASTGGLTAGRSSAEQSLFPYYTVDRLTENNENTGNKAILLVKRDQRTSLWEPFSERYRDNYCIDRNIYKNITSSTLIFEENNLDLGIIYRYAWRTSEKFGFVKTTWLNNSGDSTCQVEFIDGLQNILPANVEVMAQLTFGSLVDAYKRNELNPETGLAIFALNSNMTDLPEPSEALMATTVAQLGLEKADYLLSSVQLERFRQGKGVVTELEVRGRRGAYLVHTTLVLTPGEEHSWHLLADVYQDSVAITEKIHQLHGDRAALHQEINNDISINRKNLWKIVASADGLQRSNDVLCTMHHFANVMFNVMRGGIFVNQYWINASDFADFVSIRNRTVFQENLDFFDTLPARIQVSDLKSLADAYGSADLIRLCRTYMPINFSRRHGDPSRPWNRFSIKLKNADGSIRLDFEGNWRDIFQNWEALAYSYPEFVENMISTFLNATTVDGYNPYRITYQGVDWEISEPGNPWANIGYWSDHQIIYLQKLMEISVKVHPGELQNLLSRPLFSFSHIPYQIKPYRELLEDPYHTIVFDWHLEKRIADRVRESGTDGKLVHLENGKILQVSLTEKLLTLLLAKMANFVPEGGSWMNTQRPEWNDANNALVGKGLSVVTLCYLRRYIVFCIELFTKSTCITISISSEVYQFYVKVSEVLKRFRFLLQDSFDSKQCREIMDALGEIGSEYRWNFYNKGFSGEQAQLDISELITFLSHVQEYIEHSLRANKRTDNLYHAYNILYLKGEQADFNHLYEMLEGQVAILSSGLLSCEESLALLQNLKNSPLYQADRHSYILYPDHDLPGFLQKNSIPKDKVNGVALLKKLADSDDLTLINKDISGIYHFNGHFRNASDVSKALEALKKNPQYKNLVTADSGKILDLFEETFHHQEFTGRAGTFFAYEGLGSVYWHMVSKLLLAVQETIQRDRHDASITALIDRYVDIRRGLGFNKSPDAYGAFPSDPYSHSPKGLGAKQPGMTGMVKEEIITRMFELGLYIQDGQLQFDMLLLNPKELLTEPSAFSWLDVAGQTQSLELASGSIAYTYCQVPIILQASQNTQIEVFRSADTTVIIPGQTLDVPNSQHIFSRDGYIHHLCVKFELMPSR